MKLSAITIAVLTLGILTAEARPRYNQHPIFVDDWRQSDHRYMPINPYPVSISIRMTRVKAKRVKTKHRAKPAKHRYYQPKRTNSGVAKKKRVPLPVPRTIGGYQNHIAKSAKLSQVTPPLAAKAQQIVHACGAKVVSAYRPGARVRGSGRRSLHSYYPARAVDMQGNPACIYRHLRKWPGGKSTDYAAVRHVHISYDRRGREWGMAFTHYGKRARYARRGSRT